VGYPIPVRAVFLFCALLLLSPAQSQAIGLKTDEVTVSVFVSSGSPYVTTRTFAVNYRLARYIERAKKVPASVHPHWTRASITVKRRAYVFDHDSRLFTADRKSMLLLSRQALTALDNMVRQTEKLHFGAMTPWDEVKTHLGLKDYATVVDLETGKKFRVQRRAGSRHADVQPVSKKDTLIMKEIYQGKWSWKRRAIRVEVDGRTFAASMNGMPHGAGAIRGNDFPGHFCIHFSGSATHLRKKQDPRHQLMIRKAAGLLPQTLSRARPEEILGYFFSSLNDHDAHTLAMMTSEGLLPEEVRLVESLKHQEPVLLPKSQGELLIEAPVKVSYTTRQGRKKQATWRFWLQRFAPWERWLIAHIETEETQ